MVCGDTIGVYEPVVVRVDERLRESSLAREPRLASGGGVVMHPACAWERSSFCLNDGRRSAVGRRGEAALGAWPRWDNRRT